MSITWSTAICITPRNSSRPGSAARLRRPPPISTTFLFKTGVAKIFWTTVCTDYIFAVTFFIFLGFVARQKKLMAAAATA